MARGRLAVHWQHVRAMGTSRSVITALLALHAAAARAGCGRVGSRCVCRSTPSNTTLNAWSHAGGGHHWQLLRDRLSWRSVEFSPYSWLVSLTRFVFTVEQVRMRTVTHGT